MVSNRERSESVVSNASGSEPEDNDESPKDTENDAEDEFEEEEDLKVCFPSYFPVT